MVLSSAVWAINIWQHGVVDDIWLSQVAYWFESPYFRRYWPKLYATMSPIYWIWWFSARLQKYQCISNGVTAALHLAISPEQNGHHLADNTFKCIFWNENDRISIWISLKFIVRNPIGNKPALVHVMAWRLAGDKPLPELMLIQFTEAYMQHKGEMS